MKPGESKVVFGGSNSSENVFVDSFQNTQKLAEDSHAAAMGKPSWEQCVTVSKVVCRPYILTIAPVH